MKSKSQIQSDLLTQFSPFLKTLGTAEALLTSEEAQKVMVETTQPLRTAMVQNIRSLIPNSKRLVNSINTYRGRKGNARYTVYTGPSYRKGAGGNLAHIFEFGTTDRVHRVFDKDGNVKRVSVGMITPRPFMRPAWERTKAGIIDVTAKTFVNIIDKKITKAAKK